MDRNRQQCCHCFASSCLGCSVCFCLGAPVLCGSATKYEASVSHHPSPVVLFLAGLFDFFVINPPGAESGPRWSVIAILPGSRSGLSPTNCKIGAATIFVTVT